MTGPELWPEGGLGVLGAVHGSLGTDAEEPSRTVGGQHLFWHHGCVPECSLLTGPYPTPGPVHLQGIWRIPVDEIDRPGSFAWHMNRSIVLLLKVLAQLGDHSTLLKVSSMLQRTPDQGK